MTPKVIVLLLYTRYVMQFHKVPFTVRLWGFKIKTKSHKLTIDVKTIILAHYETVDRKRIFFQLQAIDTDSPTYQVHYSFLSIFSVLGIFSFTVVGLGLSFAAVICH